MGFLIPGSLVRVQPQTYGDVAQLVRALACHVKGCGFESRHSRCKIDI
jgi:hypothetical protein